MRKSAFQVMAVCSFLILSACRKTIPDPSAVSGKSVGAADRAVDLPDFVTYDVAIDPKEITQKTGSPCAMSMCVFEATSKEAPMKKHDGSDLCVLPESESQAILEAYFNKDDKLLGIECTVSREDYDAIAIQYRRRTFNRYLNQRDVFEDFRTYRTQKGFITTYIE